VLREGQNQARYQEARVVLEQTPVVTDEQLPDMITKALERREVVLARVQAAAVVQDPVAVWVVLEAPRVVEVLHRVFRVHQLPVQERMELMEQPVHPEP
jgi:hypothetical protein